MKIYNGERVLLGRLASLAAKEILLGEEVRIVNCDKVVISGDKFNTFAREKQKIMRGGYPLKSQVHSRMPEMLVRRTIRGMLPWKKARGKEAYRRLLCYRGLPEDFANQKIITLEDAHTSKKLPTLKHVTIGQVCKQLGGKF